MLQNNKNLKQITINNEINELYDYLHCELFPYGVDVEVLQYMVNELIELGYNEFETSKIYYTTDFDYIDKFLSEYKKPHLIIEKTRNFNWGDTFFMVTEDNHLESGNDWNEFVLDSYTIVESYLLLWDRIDQDDFNDFVGLESFVKFDYIAKKLNEL